MRSIWSANFPTASIPAGGSLLILVQTNSINNPFWQAASSEIRSETWDLYKNIYQSYRVYGAKLSITISGYATQQQYRAWNWWESDPVTTTLTNAERIPGVKRKYIARNDATTQYKTYKSYRSMRQVFGDKMDPAGVTRQFTQDPLDDYRVWNVLGLRDIAGNAFPANVLRIEFHLIQYVRLSDLTTQPFSEEFVPVDWDSNWGVPTPGSENPPYQAQYLPP